MIKREYLGRLPLYDEEDNLVGWYDTFRVKRDGFVQVIKVTSELADDMGMDFVENLCVHEFERAVGRHLPEDEAEE